MISIVIPAYNSAKLIEGTLNSITSQKYKDIEVIVVNDGSTDSTLDVLQAYAQKDSRVKVFTVPNAGPANARNFGISKAAGKYLMFVDSDDQLVEGALEWLHTEMESHSAEVYMFGHIVTDEEKNPITECSFKNLYGNAKEILKTELPALYRANLLHQIWNKAYRTDFVQKKGLLMENYHYGEDRLFVFDVLHNCENIYITENRLYYYVNQSSGSLISNYYDKKFFCCGLIDTKIRKLSQEIGCDPNIADPVWDYMYLKIALSCLINFFHRTCKLPHKIKRIKIKEILNNPQLHRKMKLDASMGFPIKIIWFVVYSKIVWLNMLMGYCLEYLMRKNVRRVIHAKSK